MALDSVTLQSMGLSDLVGNNQGGESIEVPDDPMASENAVVTPLPDGGEEIDLNPEDAQADIDHDDNLAEYMEEADLNALASDITGYVKEDRDSRADWEGMLTTAMEYLGLKIEDRTYPFPGASGVFDPILLEAVIRWHSTASAELIPAGGPVKTQIIGIPSPETEAQGSRVKEFMNFYLMDGAPEWVEQNDQMLFWLPLVGSTFKKTYQDPILNRVVSPFILPQDFIVNFSADDLETCARKTHVINMSVKDMKMRQLSGFYVDVELKEPDYNTENSSPIKDKSLSTQGLSKPSENDEAPYELYECHIDLDLKGFEHTEPEDENDTSPTETGLPLPYIVTVETGSKKVLSIRRNWKRDDASYQPIQYFTHFKFVPGLGFYGLGYSHILGNTAKSATNLQRQMSDAATLSMFPGGMKVKGVKSDDNNLMIGPCEFREFDTGGMPIQQAVTTLPYKGPDSISFELWKGTRENGRGLGGMTEIAVGEGRQDAPVGTTVALMEAANRVQSATLKAAHRAYRREFKLIAQLFGQFLPETPYPWPVSGGPNMIMRTDFSEQIDVIPVSDPNINSSTQRMMRADAIVSAATQAPEIHDLYQAYRQRYVEMGMDEKRIDMILPPKPETQPLDPLTENQNILNTKPVVAGEAQDHDSHIASHMPLADGSNGGPPNPQVQATAMAHIQEHQALKMRVQVQQILGMQLPPPGQQLSPEIENQIAALVAKAMAQISQPAGGAEPTPGQIAMEQIKVEAQKVQADIDDSKARTTTSSFEATLKYKTAEKDREFKREAALLKYHTDVAKSKEQSRSKARERAFGKRSNF